MLNNDDPLAIPEVLGTVGKEGDRAHETGGDTADMLHATTVGVVQDPGSVVAASDQASEVKVALKQLTFIRQNLGRAMAEANRLPDGQLSQLAVGEMVEYLRRSCTWLEEIRECLRKPLEVEEEVAEGEPDF